MDHSYSYNGIHRTNFLFLEYMKFILGTKEKMTQIFDNEGRVHAATILQVTPLTVTQIKTVETDGYNAIQVGFGEKKEKNINKAQRGHLKDLGNFAGMQEYRLPAGQAGTEVGDVKRGDSIELSIFEKGDTVEVSAISKGKGFQGVVKRHGFKGGRRSHGNKHEERTPGSIGATGPARVFKGQRMAGRMGSDRITVKNLTVLQVNPEANTLVIKGAIPGRRGTLVEVKSK